MDVQAVWLVVLAVATPLAGVVGFALQLRQVKQSQLENEKLRLEIAALKSAHVERASLVRVATMDEVMRYRDTRLRAEDQVAFYGEAEGEEGENVTKSLYPLPLRARLLDVGVYLLVAIFVGYLVWDLYRLGCWLWVLLGRW